MLALGLFGGSQRLSKGGCTFRGGKSGQDRSTSCSVPDAIVGPTSFPTNERMSEITGMAEKIRLNWSLFTLGARFSFVTSLFE